MVSNGIIRLRYQTVLLDYDIRLRYQTLLFDYDIRLQNQTVTFYSDIKWNNSSTFKQSRVIFVLKHFHLIL